MSFVLPISGMDFAKKQNANYDILDIVDIGPTNRKGAEEAMDVSIYMSKETDSVERKQEIPDHRLRYMKKWPRRQMPAINVLLSAMIKVI